MNINTLINEDKSFDDFLHKNFAPESDWKKTYRRDFINTYEKCINKIKSLSKSICNDNGGINYPDRDKEDWPKSEMIKMMDQFKGGPNDRQSGICTKSLTLCEFHANLIPIHKRIKLKEKITSELEQCIPEKYRDKKEKMYFFIKSSETRCTLIANSIIMNESVIPTWDTATSYKYPLPEVVPYFTPEEMEMMGVFNENPKDNYYGVKSSNNSKEWFELYRNTGDPGNDYLSVLTPIYNQYKKDPSKENKQKVLEMGWNPEVPISDKVKVRLEETKEKLLQHYGVTIISLTEEAEDTDEFLETAKTISEIMSEEIEKDLKDKSSEYSLRSLLTKRHYPLEYNEEGDIPIYYFDTEFYGKEEYDPSSNWLSNEEYKVLINQFIELINNIILSKGITRYRLKPFELEYMSNKGLISIMKYDVAGNKDFISANESAAGACRPLEEPQIEDRTNSISNLEDFYSNYADGGVSRVGGDQDTIEDEIDE